MMAYNYKEWILSKRRGPLHSWGNTILYVTRVMFISWFGWWWEDLLLQIHNGKAENCKREAATDPSHEDRVLLLLFCGNSICQSFAECCGFVAYTSSCWTDTLGILFLLYRLVFMICSSSGHGAVAWHVWVQDLQTYIENASWPVLQNL